VKYRPFTIRFAKHLWRQWKYEISPAGRYLVFALLFSGVGAVSVQMPIYQIFCALVALMFVVGTFGLILRPRVALSGSLPKKSSVGLPLSGEFTITNESWLPAFDLAVGFFGLPKSIRQTEVDRTSAYLAGGATQTSRVELMPLKRGLYELPKLRAYSTFPFQIVRFGNRHHACEPLLVLPSFHPLSGINVPASHRYQPGGIALTSNIGESPEYIGNREYVAGESVRRLDFRAWARLGKPVVREYQEEYYCRIALVLDTFVDPQRKPTPEGFAELEAAVSLTASISDALSNGEYIIDLFAAGPELYVFRAGRHTAHFENLLEILACVDACRNDPFDVVAPAIRDELGSISTAICLFLDWDESRRALAHTIVESGCQAKVLIVRDGKTTIPLEADEIEFIQVSLEDVRAGHLDTL
jgi:uncharacterized protein (DUF58 family)